MLSPWDFSRGTGFVVHQRDGLEGSAVFTQGFVVCGKMGNVRYQDTGMESHSQRAGGEGNLGRNSPWEDTGCWNCFNFMILGVWI